MKKKLNIRQRKNLASPAKRGRVYKVQVDFRAPFKMLQYITLVWDDYEKEINKENPGASKRKDFRYPPVLPIIYYEGAGSWTAAMNMKDRVFMSDIFGKYIPNFEYELICVHGYSSKELVKKGNELSLIMLINQMKNSGGFVFLKLVLPEHNFLIKILIKMRGKVDFCGRIFLACQYVHIIQKIPFAPIDIYIKSI